jgi:hypothetical protein
MLRVVLTSLVLARLAPRILSHTVVPGTAPNSELFGVFRAEEKIFVSPGIVRSSP